MIFSVKIKAKKKLSPHAFIHLLSKKSFPIHSRITNREWLTGGPTNTIHLAGNKAVEAIGFAPIFAVAIGDRLEVPPLFLHLYISPLRSHPHFSFLHSSSGFSARSLSWCGGKRLLKWWVFMVDFLYFFFRVLY